MRKLTRQPDGTVMSLRAAWPMVKKIPKQHVYPVIVVILVLIGTMTSISGSSIGMYHYVLGNGEDESLISGEPQAIRADEWMLITTKTIAQSFNNFEAYNPNIGVDGEDVSLRPDVPTTDFNTIFRPQNWAFLVLPLENAIAFKWWFFTAFVLISSYYFVRVFFTKNIAIGVLLSLFLVVSPMAQWTYREFIYLVLGFGMIGVIIADWLQVQYYKKWLKGKKVNRLKISVAMLALGFVGVGYLLVLYPPTQIAVAVILFGFFIDMIRRRKKEFRASLKRSIVAQSYLIASIAVMAVLGGVIYAQQQDTISALARTEHPGVRHFESGWFSENPGKLRNLLIGASIPRLLQKDSALAQDNYFLETKTANQSEASNYVWLTPLIIAIIAYGWIHSSRKQELPYFTIAVTLFVVSWMLIPNITIPVVDQVQPNRWNIAIGLATFLLLGFALQAAKYIQKIELSTKSYVYYAICTSFIAISVYLLFDLKIQFPALVSKFDAMLFLLLAVAAPLLLSIGRFKTGLLIIVLGSLVANMNVNPLYRGVGAAVENDLVKEVKRINNQQPGGWLMATDSVVYEHIPLLAGAKSFTSHFTYPQEFWNYFDKQGTQSKVYNRAAHTQVSLTEEESNIYLKSTNVIGVRINPCEEITMHSLDIRYVVIYNEDEDAARCLEKVSSANGAGGERYSIFQSVFYLTR